MALTNSLQNTESDWQ